MGKFGSDFCIALCAARAAAIEVLGTGTAAWPGVSAERQALGTDWRFCPTTPVCELMSDDFCSHPSEQIQFLPVSFNSMVIHNEGTLSLPGLRFAGSLGLGPRFLLKREVCQLLRILQSHVGSRIAGHDVLLHCERCAGERKEQHVGEDGSVLKGGALSGVLDSKIKLEMCLYLGFYIWKMDWSICKLVNSYVVMGQVLLLV